MPCILFISPFIWEGGPHKGKPTIYYIMQGFLRAGYEVHVVTATNKPGLRESEFEGLHIHYFHIPFNPVKFKYDALESFLTLVRNEALPWQQHVRYRLFWLQFVVFGTYHALKIARQCNPVLSYGIMNSGIFVAYLVSRRRRIPNFSRITGSYILNYLRSPLKLWLARFDEYLAFKLPCSGLIVTADGSISADEIHMQLDIPRERIWLLRNGIDKSAFLPAQGRDQARFALGLPPQAKIILSVSQLVDVKRVDRLIKAAVQIVATQPDAYFVIVGNGPERGVLEQLVHSLQLESFVRFEGFVAREELPVYFHAADVFAAFYPHSNISNSLLEAMLCGNAIVTLNNGHTGDVIRHLDNGYMVEPEHLEDIPQALIRVLTDDALRQNLGRAAAAWADCNLLTWEERIDREIAEIEAICARTLKHNHTPEGESLDK